MRAAENRRLLPDVSNAVHILDGPANRYYLGFVDIFTKYGFRQKLGQALKTIREQLKDSFRKKNNIKATQIARQANFLSCSPFFPACLLVQIGNSLGKEN